MQPQIKSPAEQNWKRKTIQLNNTAMGLKSIRRSLVATFVTTFAFPLLFTIESAARDVDLDSIYLKKNSRIYKRIIDEKFESHKTAGSYVAASGVVNALWLNGTEAAYIAEDTSVNRLMIYDMNSYRAREIARFDGLVTGLRCGSSGLIIVKMMYEEDGSPAGQTMWFDAVTGRRGIIPGANPFPDFTLSPDGLSVHIEAADGIFELKPYSGARWLVIKKNLYSLIDVSSYPSLAFFSPEGGRAAVISGSGGSYRGIIIEPAAGIRGSLPVTGITSSSEFFWLDSRSVMYRTGGPGSYSAVVLDVKNGVKKTIISQSLNTNISYNYNSRTAALLDSQMLCLYDARNDELFRSGIEGDDPSVSPDGVRLLTIIQGKLMIGRIDSLKRSDLTLKRKSPRLIDLYKEASLNKKIHENEYTQEYIAKKILIYSRYSGIK